VKKIRSEWNCSRAIAYDGDAKYKKRQATAADCILTHFDRCRGSIFNIPPHLVVRGQM